MNVLIADDEKDMLRILHAYFSKEGYIVFLAVDGEEALEIFYREKIQLAILDWMMPKVNGLEVCQEIKKHGGTKVMMLTAKSEGENEMVALQSGADDYVKKPFHPGVLLARAKKLIGEEQVVVLHHVKVDFGSKKIFYNDEDVQATKTEFELMQCFWKHKGQILSRDKLLDYVWGFDYEGDARTVDTHVRRLREKVGQDFIKTHRGMGYSLEE